MTSEGIAAVRTRLQEKLARRRYLNQPAVKKARYALSPAPKSISLTFAEAEAVLAALVVLDERPQGDWELEARALLWLSHGCPFHCLYGDDGEMQCNNAARHRPFDFKRDEWKTLQREVSALKVAEVGASPASPPPPQSPHEQAVEALAFAAGAIWDAIGLEDGLDSHAGDAVLQMIDAALIANGAKPMRLPQHDADLSWFRDYLRERLASLDALSPSPPPPQWQPIETAPRDGTPIRVYSDDFIHDDFNVSGSLEAYWQDDEGFIGAVWCSEHDHWVAKRVIPTHWMPLPVSPSPAPTPDPNTKE